MGHDTAVTSPEIVDLLNQLTQVGGFLELDQGRVGLLEGAMLSVQRATRIVVPPNEVMAAQ